MIRSLITTVAVALAAAAGAWDAAIEPAPPDGGAFGAPENTDDVRTLLWDNGIPYWMISWLTGEDTWVGNDFTAPANHRHIKKVLIYAGPTWPNGRWDGWHLAIYRMTDNHRPGSIIRGPYDIKGTSSGPAWNAFDVDVFLPTGVSAFCAAIEQEYPHPYSDAFILDSNPTYRRHSWVYYRSWFEMTTDADPYRNLMLRVVVDEETNPAVEPASLGRVKAVYY